MAEKIGKDEAAAKAALADKIIEALGDIAPEETDPRVLISALKLAADKLISILL